MKRILIIAIVSILAVFSLSAQRIDRIDYELANKRYQLLQRSTRKTLTLKESRKWYAEQFGEKKDTYFSSVDKLRPSLKNFLIIADEEFFQNHKKSINTYAEDIRTNLGLGYEIICISGKTPYFIKNLIKKRKRGFKLETVILMGKIPSIIFAHKWEGDIKVFPCDLYYMDLDGKWGRSKDFNNSEAYEYDTHEGDIYPEIMVSRIAPAYSKKLDWADVYYFFKKSHRYWSLGEPSKAKSVMAYTGIDWVNWDAQTIAPSKVYAKYNMQGHSCGINYKQKKGKLQEFYNKYIDDLGSNKYSYAFLAAHSDPYSHGSDKENEEGSLTINEIKTKKNTCLGMQLYCCSAGNWVDEYVNNETSYLVGAYLFGNDSDVLNCIASTKTGSIYDPINLYKDLSNAERAGRAMFQWWKAILDIKGNDFNKHWHYGMVMYGDPYVRFVRPVDVFVSDHDGDYGDENSDGYRIDNNAIYLTKKGSNSSSHEQLEYTGEPVCINIRVENRGIKNSSPYTELRVYWALHNDNTKYSDFLGKNSHKGTPTGGLISSILVESIQPSKAKYKKILWDLKDPKIFADGRDPIGVTYDILVELVSDEDPLKSVSTDNFKEYVKRSNNVALREEIFRGGKKYDIDWHPIPINPGGGNNILIPSDPYKPILIPGLLSVNTSIVVYPTKASDYIEIKLAKECTITSAYAVPVEGGNIIPLHLMDDKKTINVEHLSNGNYSLILIDSNNQRMQAYFSIER